MKYCRSVAILATTLCFATAAHAQRADELSSGARTTDAAVATATSNQAPADLRLQAPYRPMQIYFRTGLTVGIVVGAAYGVYAMSHCRNCDLLVVLDPIIYTALGGSVGALGGIAYYLIARPDGDAPDSAPLHSSP